MEYCGKQDNNVHDYSAPLLRHFINPALLLLRFFQPFLKLVFRRDLAHRLDLAVDEQGRAAHYTVFTYFFYAPEMLYIGYEIDLGHHLHECLFKAIALDASRA